MNRIVEDNAGGNQRRPIVRALISFAANHGYDYPDKGSNGGDGIASVVIGIRFDGLAVYLLCDLQHIPEHALLYENDDEQDIERECPG